MQIDHSLMTGSVKGEVREVTRIPEVKLFEHMFALGVLPTVLCPGIITALLLVMVYKLNVRVQFQLGRTPGREKATKQHQSLSKSL